MPRPRRPFPLSDHADLLSFRLAAGWSEDVRDVVDDVLVADLPCAVGSAEGEAVVPGLDGRDGALGAEGSGGPSALGLAGADDVERDELGFDAGLIAVDGDQMVVGGVV